MKKSESILLKEKLQSFFDTNQVNNIFHLETEGNKNLDDDEDYRKFKLRVINLTNDIRPFFLVTLFEIIDTDKFSIRLLAEYDQAQNKNTIVIEVF